MKNIHVLPTDKPSRLYYNGTSYKDANTTIAMDWYISSAGYKPYNIYITSDEEIKEGDKDFYIIANDRDKTWINRLEKVVECKIDPKHGKVLILSSGTFLWIDEGKKIILTTDQDLINDGVQAIDDEFLEWFVENPSCEEVEVEKEQVNNKYGSSYSTITIYKYKIIIPKEEPKQETLEEAASNYAIKDFNYSHDYDTFMAGAKWQRERMYSEKEVLKLLIDCKKRFSGSSLEDYVYDSEVKEWFEQLKKKS